MIERTLSATSHSRIATALTMGRMADTGGLACSVPSTWAGLSRRGGGPQEGEHGGER